MKDDKHEGCGIYPILWRGWSNRACKVHDEAYTNNSDAEKWLTRKEVDDALLRDLLMAASKGNFRAGKRAAAYAMYGAVRLLGGLFWEGKR